MVFYNDTHWHGITPAHVERLSACT